MATPSPIGHDTVMSLRDLFCIPIRQKKANHCLANNIARGHPPIAGRALGGGLGDSVRDSRVELDDDTPAASGNTSNTHWKQNVAHHLAGCNTGTTLMQQSVAVATRSNLGTVVASLREQRGMTQAELGVRIGLSRQRVTHLEMGRTMWPSQEIFNGLAEALEVPVTTLLRAAGLDLPDEGAQGNEELEWLVNQLDERGISLLITLGRALLPEYRRRPERDGS